MKQIKFFAVAFAALTMFSCSKENVETSPNNAPGEKTSLTIAVTGQGNITPDSRTAGGAGTTDVTVNDYIVFLFRDGGGLDCPAQHSASADPMTISGTTAAKKAYVVANTGELAGGLFAAVASEADLKTVAGDLMKDATTSTQTPTNLWMSGSGAIVYTTTGDVTKGAVTVALTFVAAKIELIVYDKRTNMTGGNITISDKAVVLLFAGKAGKFFETPENKVKQTEFYSGDRSYPNPATATEFAVLSDAVTTPFTENAGNAISNHFYTFGNNGETIMPTILAIKSEKITNSGAPVAVYYPIHFTPADAGLGNTIVPGNQYTVKLTLKGDVAGGGGGGTIDPEDPVSFADITITVTGATWNPVTVGKEFN